MMIRYTSTRGNTKAYTFSEAILQGIAPDGGLLVPQTIPTFSLDNLRDLSNASYQEAALFLFKLFQTDITEKELKQIIKKAYGMNFDSKKIAPVVKLYDNQYMLELWHGPTAAFKDMALQIMPLFFAHAVSNQDKKYLILVATSGDTGKAALEGYKDKKNISIIVFYPDGRVSQLQELQMVTQVGKNVSVVAVHGDFDAVQTLVKEIFADKKFNKELLDNHQVTLSSANSINWGRLLPQIIYYITSYIYLAKTNAIIWGDTIDISIPTGNFGNILAAYLAKQMGLPIRKLICASNANNVLTDFIKTGTYDITTRKLLQTPSPSMDILIASNIERILYLVTKDTKKVSSWMQSLKTSGKFKVDQKTKQILQTEFAAGWVSNKDSLANIKSVYEQTKNVIDPHTSVAQLVAQRFTKKSSHPMLIASTAHWGKFAKVVHNVFAKTDKPMTEFEMLEAVCKLAPKASLPQSLLDLKHKKIRHTQKSEPTKKAAEKIIKEVVLKMN